MVRCPGAADHANVPEKRGTPETGKSRCEELRWGPGRRRKGWICCIFLCPGGPRASGIAKYLSKPLFLKANSHFSYYPPRMTGIEKYEEKSYDFRIDFLEIIFTLSASNAPDYGEEDDEREKKV